MRRLLVTLDVEEIDWGRPRPGSQWEPWRPSAEGLGLILPMLEQLGIVATLFCTASFARARSELVRDAVARNHEIASHGLDHRDDYAAMQPEAAWERLRSARLRLEDVAGAAVRGLRTPRLAPCAAAVVAEAGYAYDASPHPTWLGHGWRGLRTTRRPWLEAGVVCVPLSTTPGLRLPVGWYVLRAFGVSLSALLARWAGVGTPWVHLYFHPWEASDIRPWLGAHPLARGTGPGWVTSLRRLLERVAPQLLPSTVGAAVEAWRADPLRGA